MRSYSDREALEVAGAVEAVEIDRRAHSPDAVVRAVRRSQAPKSAQKRIMTAYAARSPQASVSAPGEQAARAVEAMPQPSMTRPITKPRPSAERCAPAAASG